MPNIQCPVCGTRMFVGVELLVCRSCGTTKALDTHGTLDAAGSIGVPAGTGGK